MNAAESINYVAVIVAAVSSFVLGGLWYAPFLFGKAWMKETGLTEEQLGARSLVLVFGLSFVLSLVGSFVFAMFLGPNPGFGLGFGAGLSAGLFWVAGSFGINYLFEKKSLKLWLINGGYHTLQYTLIGAVLGLLL
ncbi:MAG: DUF1761 domain-containing protein [Acidobacteriota bacterium]